MTWKQRLREEQDKWRAHYENTRWHTHVQNLKTKARGKKNSARAWWQR